MSEPEKKKLGRPRKYTPEEYKERVREKQKAYRSSDGVKERIREYNKNYMKEHPEYWERANEKRRLKKIELKKLKELELKKS